MRILITGVTGYIGSSLARCLLAEGHQVFGLVREPVRRTYLQDLADRLTLLPCDGTGEGLARQMEHCKPELAYHLAAHYTGAHDLENIREMLASNIALGAYLLESLAACGCRNFIYASSIMEHYRGREYCPLNLYAATKRAFCDLLCYYADAGLLHTGVLVLSDTYGPGDQRPKILNLIRRRLGTEEPIDLSDGGQDYAAVYIDDVVSAFVLAGRQLCEGQWDNRSFQILPAEIHTLRETVDQLVRISGETLCARWGALPAAGRQIRRVPRLYPPVPGWAPRVTLEEGYRRLLGREVQTC
ncbi:NAD-dependent epimerase/dehydratase family protein [Pseudoflavonifractor phocaeensis]|uniref:NAD-dependent epimerase/dehydratase family protein n=1 Tax=Pseudoflavonifractor phocaeensis TaxID=1870988 RepID=UPI001956941C|nr:NAD(P)-dependent oxidoreductase [Pseudoflavonifractor phocaeensis]MBM6886920.1 NAD(P)-dependent oxidoreductase [Pseudoflavonifractor phocaeensis]